jgi:hypothetical protein
LRFAHHRLISAAPPALKRRYRGEEQAKALYSELLFPFAFCLLPFDFFLNQRSFPE